MSVLEQSGSVINLQRFNTNNGCRYSWLLSGQIVLLKSFGPFQPAVFFSFFFNLNNADVCLKRGKGDKRVVDEDDDSDCNYNYSDCFSSDDDESEEEDDERDSSHTSGGEDEEGDGSSIKLTFYIIADSHLHIDKRHEV